ILAKKKIILHQAVGNAIEKVHKEHIDEYYSVLAEHHIASKNYEKGAEFLKLEASKARKRASFNEAIDFGKKVTACLEKLPRNGEVVKKLIDAKVTLGLYYNQMFQHFEANEAIEPIFELALERDYKKRISQICIIVGTYSLMIEGNYPKAIQYLQDAIRIAEKTEDRLSLSLANHWIAHALAESCEFSSALLHLEKVMEINVAANVTWAIAAMQGCISMTVYNNQGRADLGIELSRKNLKFADEYGDAWSRAEAHTYYGSSCYLKGSLDEAEEYLLKAIDYCERISFLAMGYLAHFFLGETYFDLGEYQKSKNNHEEAISLQKRCRAKSSITSSNEIALARAKVMVGDRDIEIESLYGYADENKMKIHDGMLARYISEILLNIDDKYLSAAEDWINKAIEKDKRNGMVWWHLARDHALYSELNKRKGDNSNAAKHLTKTIEIFKSCGADGWVELYKKKLATIR
ncbi:MAG: hypothetical protein ACR2PH_09825, partial [Desulfobulbia bacterium]